jgi:hypothetical protein
MIFTTVCKYLNIGLWDTNLVDLALNPTENNLSTTYTFTYKEYFFLSYMHVLSL